MTIYTTLFFPLSGLDIEAAAAAGWERGPFATGSSRFHMPTLDSKRTLDYVNRSPLEHMLDPKNRVHRMLPKTPLKYWKVVAAELVECGFLQSRVGGEGEGEVRGYLLVHIEQLPDAPDIAAITRLGEWVRPVRSESQLLLATVRESAKLGTVPWQVAAVARVFALSLSDTPETDHPGSVRWEGSSAVDRRFAGLLALPAKSAIRVSEPFPVQTSRPTPSFELAVGRWSAVAIRLRVGVRSGIVETLGRGHAARARTTWTDAVLLELTQRDALTAMIRGIGNVRLADDRRRWRRLSEEFNNWRSDWALRAVTDHPFEGALAEHLRAALGTQELIDLLGERISAHADAESVESTARLTFAVTILTVAATLLPVLLALAVPDWREVLGGPFFWITLAALVAFVLSCWAWTKRRP